MMAHMLCSPRTRSCHQSSAHWSSHQRPMHQKWTTSCSKQWEDIKPKYNNRRLMKRALSRSIRSNRFVVWILKVSFPCIVLCFTSISQIYCELIKFSAEGEKHDLPCLWIRKRNRLDWRWKALTLHTRQPQKTYRNISVACSTDRWDIFPALPVLCTNSGTVIPTPCPKERLNENDVRGELPLNSTVHTVATYFIHAKCSHQYYLD